MTELKYITEKSCSHLQALEIVVYIAIQPTGGFNFKVETIGE